MKDRKRMVCAGLAFLLFAVNIAPEDAVAKGKKLQLNYTKKTMTVGSSFRLRVKGRAAQNKKIIWKSSKKSVANVTGQGKVTAKKAGKAQIIVRISGTNKKAICSLTIRKKVPSTTVSPSAPLAQEGISPSPDSGKTDDMTSATASPDPVLTAQPDVTESPSASSIPGGSPSYGGNEATMTPEPPVQPPSLPGQTVQPSSLPGQTVQPSSLPGQTVQPSSSPTQTVQPGQEPIESAMPMPSPGGTPVAVDSSILVVEKRVITVDNTVMTAYLINKKFSGEICISLNGKEYAISSSGRSLLSLLKRGAATKENADGTIRVSREGQEEYWTIEDRQYQKTYFMKADTANTLNTSLADCGVIYILGDVGLEIEISGRV